MRNKFLGALLSAAVGCGSEAATGIDGSSGASVPEDRLNANGAQTAPSQAASAGSAAMAPREMGAKSVAASAPATSAAAAPSSAATATSAAPATAAASGATPSTPVAMPGEPISAACRGFAFEGLIYSPGGDVLPNKCAPFHATLNNPYAVRCVDVWPWFKTNYMGDAYCILPPTPGKGVQLGHHPQGEDDAWFKAASKGDMSGYEAANIPEGWLVDPAGEEERNINIRHSNDGGNYWRTYSRMRGGSHHMIASTTTSTDTFKWGPGSPDGLFSGSHVPGSQRTDDNNPGSAEVPEEDDGLYATLGQKLTVLYNMHHFNPTDKPILKEAWQNLWWTDNAKTAVGGVVGLSLDQTAETFAQPGEITDFHYSTTAPGAVRILSLFGHRHAWTTNFTAWVERTGSAQPEIVYQSFDWFDEPTYQYNSQVKNPNPAWMNRTDGGHSGILSLEAGDKLHFNCHIEYTDERALEARSPVKPAQNGPLRFANAAFTAEMCILFGNAVGSNGLPSREGPPPDFARAH